MRENKNQSQIPLARRIVIKLGMDDPYIIRSLYTECTEGTHEFLKAELKWLKKIVDGALKELAEQDGETF